MSTIYHSKSHHSPWSQNQTVERADLLNSCYLCIWLYIAFLKKVANTEQKIYITFKSVNNGDIWLSNY